MSQHPQHITIMDRQTMTAHMVEQTILFLTQSRISFVIESDTVLSLDWRGRNELWKIYISTRPEQGLIGVFSIVPFTAPPARHAAVLSFVNRANYGMYMGNFEMDHATGQIQCRTGADVSEVEVTAVMIRHLLFNNVMMMDRYLVGLRAVVEGRLAVDDAIRQSETPNRK